MYLIEGSTNGMTTPLRTCTGACEKAIMRPMVSLQEMRERKTRKERKEMGTTVTA